MRTHDYIGCQGNDAAADLVQLQTFVQTFAVPLICHITWSRCASLVARPGEYLLCDVVVVV